MAAQLVARSAGAPPRTLDSGNGKTANTTLFVTRGKPDTPPDCKASLTPAASDDSYNFLTQIELYAHAPL